jgi:hypothetical protein
MYPRNILFAAKRLAYAVGRPKAESHAWNSQRSRAFIARRALLRRSLGGAATAMAAALASASRILPLVTTAHHPSAAKNAYWPDLYTDMPIVDEARPHPYRDTATPPALRRRQRARPVPQRSRRLGRCCRADAGCL